MVDVDGRIGTDKKSFVQQKFITSLGVDCIYLPKLS